MTSFETFFRSATDSPPYGYQARIARVGLPTVVQAPTGAGKTGIVLAWLWRRLHGPDPGTIPRRLVYALPQRSLVEQVAEQVSGWLAKLGLEQQVALHVVMGGAGRTQWQWRMDMHEPAIVVGTVDSLVSKALNRGYGIGRATYPIDFALVTNGAHWIIDEVQLCPESTTTLRQLAAFAAGFGTAEPVGLTCMSATITEYLLATVDNPAPSRDDVITIQPEDRVGELAIRLGATRMVRRLAAEPGGYPAVAREVAGLHRPGSLTLVVLNTVAAARDVHKALRDGAVPCTLLHSRFRARERAGLARKIGQPPGEAGHIVVATQVVEAGIDLNAAVLVTEAAPWPNVVQRAGRCNRTGRVDEAGLWWLPPSTAAPYLEADVKAAVAELERIEGAVVTGEELLAREVAVTELQVAALRRPDLVGLFDTAPDLSGADLDIAPYVRDADDLDAQLAWATWTPEADAPDGRPPADAKAPEAPWRCRVPLGELAKLAKRASIWRLDQAIGRWTKVGPAGPDRARPGEVLVMAAADGGYDPETGFDPASKQPVPDCPPLGVQGEVAAQVPGSSPESVVGVAAGLEDAFAADSASVAQRGWVSLRQHSEDARDQARGLIGVMQPNLSSAASEAAVMGAYLHDAGKAYPTWQDALCELAPPQRREEIAAGRPWAKSDSDKPLRFHDQAMFRHELASLLLMDGPLRSLLAGMAEPGLTRYLVLAHHGRLRVQVRDPAEATPGKLLGLAAAETKQIPGIFGLPESELTVDLGQFGLGGERSWTRDALELRDRYGPFVLAYLESLVRVADWRASAGREVPR
jgi:CRISPR-associated endonuclease/helicase Cas3